MEPEQYTQPESTSITKKRRIDGNYTCAKCDFEFLSVTELEAHNSQEFCTNITALDENCLDMIFKFLSPNDLAAMSLTCKRYKELTERYFYLNCETEPIFIQCTVENTEFLFQSADRFAYEETFSSLIRSVYVCCEPELMNHSFEFIRNNCAKRLRSLSLFASEIESKIKVEQGVIIKDQLEFLKKLKITNITSEDVYATLLQHCKHLEVLEIFENFAEFTNEQSTETTTVWLNQTYANLKSVTVCISKLDSMDFTNFFQLNPQLKNVIVANGSAIKSLCRSDLNLNYAALLFQCKKQYQDVNSDIIEWCKRKHCDKLELVLKFHPIDETMIRTAINLNNIRSLHLYDARAIFSTNIKLKAPTITELCLKNIIAITDDMSARLDAIFPNLCELKMKIIFDADNEIERFNDKIMPIMNHFKKLKHFWFTCLANYQFTDINELNQARSTLMDACQMTIHINSLNNDDLDSIQSQMDFIKIQSNWSPFCTLCVNSENEDVDQRVPLPNTDLDYIPEIEFNEHFDSLDFVD